MSKHGKKINRREFLQLTATGAAGAVLTSCTPHRLPQPLLRPHGSAHRQACSAHAQQPTAAPDAPSPRLVEPQDWLGTDR